MSELQCQELTDDRLIGTYWEREFCKEMARRGKEPEKGGRGKPHTHADEFERWGDRTDSV